MRFDRADVYVLVGVYVLATGCSDDPTAPVQAVAPTPNTPVNAVRLLEWGWDHRTVADQASVLAADFVFIFAPDDATGDHFPGRALTRAQEMAAAQALFVDGAGAHSRASSIRLDPGAQLFDIPDFRPGKDPTWHRLVESRFDLTVVADTTTYAIRGGATFFLVRGDSALLPPGPLERVAAADSTRWFLERVEERPAVTSKSPTADGMTGLQDTLLVTWGYLKWRYLGSPAGASALSRTVRRLSMPGSR